MAEQNWRNPYYQKKRRKPQPRYGMKKPGTALASNGGANSQLFDVMETFHTVHGQVKNISSTVRQVEEMFDSMHTIVNTFQGLGAISKTIDVTPSKKTAITESSVSPEQSMLGNIDMEKITQMLQSPIVKSLLSSSKEKGE